MNLTTNNRSARCVGLQAVCILVVQHHVGPKGAIKKWQNFRVVDEVYKRIAPVQDP